MASAVEAVRRGASTAATGLSTSSTSGLPLVLDLASFASALSLLINQSATLLDAFALVPGSFRTSSDGIGGLQSGCTAGVEGAL